MRVRGGDPPSLTDSEVDALAWEFLRSPYGRDMYVGWPLDRRLHGFLRWRGLPRFADDGDFFNILLERVMASVSIAPRSHRPGKQATGGVRESSQDRVHAKRL